MPISPLPPRCCRPRHRASGRSATRTIADHLRTFLDSRGTTPVIPNKTNRKALFPFDAELYKLRNVIERTFCRLKDFRAIATRYDKTARNFLAGLSLLAALL